jgi:hypothetical protein
MLKKCVIMLFLCRIFISPQLQYIVYQCVTKVFLEKNDYFCKKGRFGRRHLVASKTQYIEQNKHQIVGLQTKRFGWNDIFHPTSLIISRYTRPLPNGKMDQ